MCRIPRDVIETLLQSVLLHSAGFCNGQAVQLHRDIYSWRLPTFHDGKRFYNFRRTICAFLNYAALWPSMKTRRFSTNTGLSTFPDRFLPISPRRQCENDTSSRRTRRRRRQSSVLPYPSSRFELFAFNLSQAARARRATTTSAGK